MSEVIVAKAGGTSNATSEAVLQSLEWAEQSDIFVVSAPGVIKGADEPKVTRLLEGGYKQYVKSGEVDASVPEKITERFDAIVRGLGKTAELSRWVDDIAPRVVRATSTSHHAASMLGERLQAELYSRFDYTLLDPASAPHDLGSDPVAWRGWLSETIKKGTRYVLPGNTTKIGNELFTFDTGGSDISGGLAAYGIDADLHLNLTDGPAMSADPNLIDIDRLAHIDHMLYSEARELGRNGTGLVHPAALVPLMIAGSTPTEIRSTFDRNTPYTTLDNDYVRANHRSHGIIALSLMRDVAIHSVYEPGMAESVGRLAELDRSLAEKGIAIVDSQGNGVDGQNYYTAGGETAAAAEDALRSVVRYGHVWTRKNIDLITMVGYNLGHRLIDSIFEFAYNGGIDAQAWQAEGHDLSHGQHSLRISVSRDDSEAVLSALHTTHIEQRPVTKQ